MFLGPGAMSPEHNIETMRLAKILNPDSESPERSFPAIPIVIVLAIISFSPVLVAGYVRLDDYDNILRNPSVQSFSLSGFKAIWTESRLGFYIPITYSIWWLYAGLANALGTLSQSAPLFHSVNLTLHILNTLLVFSLSRTLLRLLRPRLPALSDSRIVRFSLVVALVFGLHPAQVETVAWITELKGITAGLLGLLGIWNYYRSPRKGVTALLFIAAMLSKPSAIVFPGIILLIDRILLDKSMKESVKDPLVFWVPLLPFVLITKYLQPDLNMEYVPTIFGRSIVAADAFSFYCRKLLFPAGLALDYGRSPLQVLHRAQGWQGVISMLLSIASGTLVIYSLLRPRRPHRQATVWSSLVLCGWSIYCLSLLPVLGFVPFAFQDFTTVADHYLYIPLLGAGLMAMGILLRLDAKVPSLLISAAIVVTFVPLSCLQAMNWRSTETLFNHTLTINPQSYVARYSIATEMLDAGRTDEGILHLRKCLQIRPNYLSAQIAIGIAWIHQGRYQEAIDYYESVLSKNPSGVGKRAVFMAMIYNNFGSALCSVGREKEGAEQFRKAVEVDPSSITGHMNLGRFALRESRFKDAVIHYQAALALSPSSHEIQQLLSLASSRIH